MSHHNSLHFLQPHDIICFKVISYSVLLLGTWHLILIIFESTSPQQYSETWSLHVLEMISRNWSLCRHRLLLLGSGLHFPRLSSFFSHPSGNTYILVIGSLAHVFEFSSLILSWNNSDITYRLWFIHKVGPGDLVHDQVRIWNTTLW